MELTANNIHAARQTKQPLHNSGEASIPHGEHNQTYQGKPFRYQELGLHRKSSIGSVV